MISDNQEQKNCSTSKQFPKQIIRVIFSDPDATDSSDEEKYPRRSFVRMKVNGVTRMVREMCISKGSDNVVSSAFKGGNKARRDRPNTDGKVTEKAASKSRRGSSKYPGVRARGPGRWAASILNPFLRKSEWLGTYNSEEQAHDAREKRKREFDLQALQKENNSSAVPAVATLSVTVSDPATTSVGDLVDTELSTSKDIKGKSMSNQPSPSSVLDIPVENYPNVLIKADDNQNIELNDGTPDEGTLLGVPSLNEELNIGIDLVSSAFFGIDFDNFFDELKTGDFSTCDLSGVGLSDLSDVNFDITDADIGFVDKVLGLAGV